MREDDLHDLSVTLRESLNSTATSGSLTVVAVVSGCTEFLTDVLTNAELQACQEGNRESLGEVQEVIHTLLAQIEDEVMRRVRAHWNEEDEEERWSLN